MQCKAKTKKGKRCKRKAVHRGHCCVHKKTARLLTDYPPGNLDEVPDAPDDLEVTAASRWAHYCRLMIDEGRLKGVYLHGLHELCRLEQDLEYIRADLRIMGRYNTYHTKTGDRGIQSNGVNASLQTTQKRIEKLRETYGLIPSMKQSSSQKKREPAKLRSVKNF